MLVDAAARFEHRYGEITIPTAIIAGEADDIIETAKHSVRLHEQIPESTLRVLPDLGHMAHHYEPVPFAEAVHAIAGREALGAARETLQAD